mgnify:CR=1 FL=1
MKTIAALATPPGVSGIAVIRVSGPEVFSAIDKIFQGKQKPSEMKSHTIHYGDIIDIYNNNIIVDKAIISIFKAPNSFTGDDVIEISCHGGKITPSLILDLLYKMGISPAEPGEFTKMAFLNGKMDLVQAEAVADLIHSISVNSSQTAARQLNGNFSKSISDLRQQLIKICSLLEIDLDFINDDVEFSDYDRMNALINDTILFCENLINQYKADNILRSGFHIAIIGYPNSGKSSLFNALLNKNRAIVSNIPGTTRDYIEDYIYVNNIPVKLIDTAGLRDTIDIIELDGIKLAENMVSQADLILLINDLTLGENHSNKLFEYISNKFKEIPIVILQNKIDIATTNDNNDLEQYTDNNIYISAKKSIGLHDISNIIVKYYNLSINPSQNILVNERHKALLINVIEELSLAKNALKTHSNELAAINIRNAANYFGEISGESFNNDVLNSIFSKFCIGK